MSKKELRRFNVTELEVRKDTEDNKKIRGYAAVFDQETVIAGVFREVIRPKAFQRALNEKHDVRALVDHESSKILGRTKSGTLTLSEDKKGLYMEIDPADTQLTRDTMLMIERGDIDQMSFGFIPKEVTWRDAEDGELELREILDVDLFDVSVVTFPAYDGTEVSVRSAKEIRENEKPKVDNSDSEEQNDYDENENLKLKIQLAEAE